LTRLLAVFLGACALCATALARPPHKPAPGPAPHTIFRVADHGSFGRVVFQLPASATSSPTQTRVQTQAGDLLTLTIQGAGPIAAAVPGADLTRHVRGIDTAIDTAILRLDPGSTARVWRQDGRLIVDVFAPGAAPAAAPPIAPSPAAHPAARLAGADSAPPAATPKPAPAPSTLAAAPLNPATPPPPPAEAQRQPDPAQAAEDPTQPAQPPAQSLGNTDSLLAVRLPGPDDAILLPFAPATGAAAFIRNGQAVAVFDDSKAIDLSGLRADPVFGAARISLLPAATVLTLPAQPSRFIALHREKPGWVLRLQPGRGPAEGAPIRFSAGVLTVAAPHPAGSVVMVDAETGGKLLVGTVRDHGPAVLVPHASPDFTLLPSWEGVVVLAGSDRAALRAVRAGFTLQAATGPPLSAILDDASQAAMARAGALTHRFDFPPLPVPDLLLRLDGDTEAAAAAPKQARFEPRLRVAQDMLALGMDQEAAAVLNAARADDPAQQNRPDALALLAMAAFLESGADSAPAPGPAVSPLDNAALGNADEIALWRALLPAHPIPVPERAAVAAADWRLLLAYPDPLRRRLLPAAASLLLDGQQTEAAAALLADSDDPSLDLARARLLRAQGKTDAALTLLDQVTAGDDRKAQALARRAAIDMRLAAGTLTPAKAAASLLSHLDDWREPDLEIATRIRAGKLLVQADDFRHALATLRDTERLFPAAHDSVHEAERQAVAALVKGGAASRLSPLDLVALVEENRDLLAADDVASSLTPVLADKLVALDLPERAGKLVAALMEATAAGAAKAALGDRLAGLRLDQQDAMGAIAALDASDSADLPAECVESRLIKRARAAILIGRNDDALRLLATSASHEALTLRASLLEASHDWRGAEASLQMLLGADVPKAGVLTDAQQDLVLRFASAASQAGDTAALRALQDGLARRLTPGPRAALFQTLAALPVRSVADLPRSGREADAARALPTALSQYDSR
jgi:hypothetical protein